MKISPKISLLSSILFGAFALSAGTGLTVSSAWLITMASEHPPIMILGVSIVMVRFFGIFRSASRYVERVLSHEAIFRKLTSIRVELFQSISSRLREVSIAPMVKTVIDDVERAQEFYLRITLPQYAAAISGATTAALALWVSVSTFLWIVPTTLIFALLIPVLTRFWVDPVSFALEEKENRFAVEISNASHAQVEAELFGYGQSYRSALVESAEELSRNESKYFTRISILQILVTLSLASSLIGIASSAIESEELLPVHISMGIFLVLVGFEGYTTWFPNLFSAGKNRRAQRTVEELISSQEKHPIPEVNTPRDFVITCAEVSAYWDAQFLAPVTFSVAPGETVLLTGPSGVGKSTLASALFGFAHYSGEIQVGGVDLAHLPDGVITGTLQRGHIFNTTLRENLRIARENVTDQELIELLKLMDLDSISLDEVLGEFGRALSGGEAKRLSITRALISAAPIVILDEPLEHLDSALSGRIQSAITRLCADRALIVITHAPWLKYSRKLELTRE
jgi:ABC-type transport system involved in cytochrome bd biosynthesis fused ATPase/permease subunit